jgi:hypothetical protein
MARHQFGYLGEEFSLTRLSLMLPHPIGEDSSIADAFNVCSLGLRNFRKSTITDVNAREWLESVEKVMSAESVDDPTGEGTWIHRARSMTIEEKRGFSHAVDQLASWFWREFRSSE